MRLTEATEVSKFYPQTSCLTARWKENHRSEKKCQSPLYLFIFFSFGLVSLLQERWNRTNNLDWFVVFWAKWLYRGFFFFFLFCGNLGRHLSDCLYCKTIYCTVTGEILNLTYMYLLPSLPKSIFYIDILWHIKKNLFIVNSLTGEGLWLCKEIPKKFLQGTVIFIWIVLTCNHFMVNIPLAVLCFLRLF